MNATAGQTTPMNISLAIIVIAGAAGIWLAVVLVVLRFFGISIA